MKTIPTIRQLALTACAVFTLGSASADDLLIGMSFQEMNNEYFVVMHQALEDAAESMGADVVVTDARHNVAKQVSDIEDMVQRGIDILLINPTDSVGVQSAVRYAKDEGVIVVAVDAQAEGPIDAFVGSRNQHAGYLACDYLATSLGGKGEIAILDGIPVVPILERVEGCREAIAEHPDMSIVTVQNGQQQRSVALSVTENMLAAHPDLAGIFSVNDGGAMGSYAAINASGRNVKLVSVDGAPDAIAAMQEPNSLFVATAAQYPRDQVRLGLGVAMAKYWGANVPSQIPVDVTLIDQDAAPSFSW
ncbi:ABC transporter substrate-binding protein [Saccharospirillum mangrovi]|uniref:ABC transporter substrate-binding protein n=1 Tax=Saccharospirillum mangrovi TaxID=2161747 RepID=UPI000D373E48|nr:ABC transporter substrate-binding protein [Saccharospirillum mangrovi]